MDIRTLCLGVLTFGDATGYEIKKMFEDGMFSHFYEASFGSIYPALNRLTEERLVECTQQAQDKRPDKKIYSLTPTGRSVFAAEITIPPGRDKLRSEFLVNVIFSEFLAPNQLRQVLDERIRFHHQKLDEMNKKADTCGANAARQFTLGYGLALHKAAAEYLTQNRNLLEDASDTSSEAAE
jgi:PadR family transcriptional regulator AphA